MAGASARIDIDTIVHSEQVEQLNRRLASGQVELRRTQRELRDLERQTNNGANATREQSQRMQELQQRINSCRTANSQYNRALNDTIRQLNNMSNGVNVAGGSMSKLGGIFKNALGVFAGNIITGIAGQITQLVSNVISLGAKTQQTIAQLGAMKNNALGGYEAYKAFNDVLRDTNYDTDTVFNMGKEMINLGMNANQAAEMIRILADTSAGLGKDASGAQALWNQLNMINSTGKFTERNLKALQQEGIRVEEAFAKAFGTDTQTAMDAIKKGAVGGKDAFEILVNFMEKNFPGSMQKSKDNVIDGWGDLKSNLETACGEIGKSIFDAFNKSQIIQSLIEYSNLLVNFFRGKFSATFMTFGKNVEFIFSAIKVAIDAVILVIKSTAVVVDELKTAFENMWNDVSPYLEGMINGLKWVWGWIQKILRKTNDQISKGFATKFKIDTKIPIKPKTKESPINYKGDGNYSFNIPAKSGSDATTQRDDTVNKLQKELNKRISETKALYEHENKLLTENYNSNVKLQQIKNDINNLNKTGLALSSSKNMQEKKANEEELKNLQKIHDKKIEELEAEKAILQENKYASLQDTQEKLENIQKQIEKENELHENKMAGLKSEYALKDQLNQLRLAKEAEEERKREDDLKRRETNEQKYYKNIINSFSESMASCIINAENFGEVFKNIIQQIIQQLIVAAMYASIVSALGLGGGKGFVSLFNGKLFGGYAEGGYVNGPGTSTSDSIPARLSNGEYVLNAATVDKIGVANLDRLNYGMPNVQYANSGYGSNNSSNLSFNINAIDSSGFANFLSRGGLDAIKKALYESDRRFASTAGVF